MIYLQQKIALVMSFLYFSDRCGFETEKVRGGRGLGWSAGRGLAKFLKLLRERTKNFNPRRTLIATQCFA